LSRSNLFLHVEREFGTGLDMIRWERNAADHHGRPPPSPMVLIFFQAVFFRQKIKGRKYLVQQLDDLLRTDVG